MTVFGAEAGAIWMFTVPLFAVPHAICIWTIAFVTPGTVNMVAKSVAGMPVFSGTLMSARGVCTVGTSAAAKSEWDRVRNSTRGAVDLRMGRDDKDERLLRK